MMVVEVMVIGHSISLIGLSPAKCGTKSVHYLLPLCAASATLAITDMIHF
jgi:hypothetical protein